MSNYVFFCYAREDEAFVVPLAQQLKQRGVAVWLDQWDISAEADWDKTIDQALHDCARLLMVLSPSSVNSGEVRGELREALDLGKPILPVLYKPCEIPRQLRVIQFVDFSGPRDNHEAALEKLLSACRGEAEEVKLVRATPPPAAGKATRAARLGSRTTLFKALAAALVIGLAVIVWIVLSSKAEERRRINSAALSPNGLYLAAATGQGLGVGNARIWEVNSGRQLHRFTTEQGPFWIVAWSPSGDKLAIGDHEGKIRTYETSTWTLSSELDGPRSYIRFIVWSPDGKALATGDDTGTLWVWDVVSGKQLFRCSPHSQNIAVAAWSPDGGRLATGSWDHSVAIVDGRDGHLIARLQGHTSYVEALAWSPDGKLIASGSLESPYLIVWDASGRPRSLEGHQSSVQRVAWSPDGSYLASASKDNSVQFWDGKTFNNVAKFSLHGSFNSGDSLAWSKEGNRLAAGDEATVSILNPQGDVMQKFLGYSKDPYNTIEMGGWSLDGKRLAAFRTSDGAKVWDTVTGSVIATFRVGFFEAISQ
jgi:WD40 repeat protein